MADMPCTQDQKMDRYVGVASLDDRALLYLKLYLKQVICAFEEEDV